MGWPRLFLSYDPNLPTIFYLCTLTVMWKNAISVLQWPLSIPLATKTLLPLQDTRIWTWWWPPEAETCRFIIKIPYIIAINCFAIHVSCLILIPIYTFCAPEAETCRFIIKIPYINCNKLFCNLCLVFNLNSYIYFLCSRGRNMSFYN